jgi:hypothetical protein
MIRDGALTEPVAAITIAGTLQGMFAHLTPAVDLKFRHGTDSPTVRVEGITMAGLGQALFAPRWVMVLFYVGLISALLMLAVKVVQKLVADVPALLEQSVSETIFAVLSLIDLSLVANLVVIVMFARWENFIGRLLGGKGKHDLTWLGSLIIGDGQAEADRVRDDDRRHLHSGWELAILLVIGVTGVLLAVMYRLAEKK